MFLESLTVPGKNKHCESDRSYGIEGKEDVETNQELFKPQVYLTVLKKFGPDQRIHTNLL